MLSEIEYIGLRCGDYNWMCCISPDRAGQLFGFIRSHTRADFDLILSYCQCSAQPTGTQNPPNAGSTPSTPSTTPTLSQLTTAMGSISLPSDCSSLRDYICSKTVGLVVNALCAVFAPPSNPMQAPMQSAPPQGILLVVQFLCAVYQLACQDDRAAAAFVIGWNVLNDLLARKVISEASLGSTQVQFFFDDLLTRMESAIANVGCGAELLTQNATFVSLLQQLAAAT